jgi:hypothetical protein
MPYPEIGFAYFYNTYMTDIFHAIVKNIFPPLVLLNIVGMFACILLRGGWFHFDSLSS